MKMTSADKRLVRDNIKRYARAARIPPASLALQRTNEWLAGYSMAEIAEDEDVSKAAVAQSISNLVTAIIDWTHHD